MSEIRIEKITKVDKKFLATWERLWRRSYCAHFFNSPIWFDICLKTFSAKEFVIFVAKKQKEVQAIFPLIKDSHYLVTVLRSPGGKYLDRSTLLLKEKNKGVIVTLFEKIQECGNFYFAEVDEEIVGLLSLDKANLLILPSSLNPYLPIENNPFRFLSKKNLSKIRNRFEKNKRYLTFINCRGSNKLLEKVFEIDAKSSKAKKGMQTFSDPYVRLLFKNMASISPKHFRLSVLFFKKTPFVFSLGVVYRKTFQAIQTAYLPEFKHLLPGKLLLYFLLHELKKEGIEVFDFSRGESTIKSEFTPLSRYQYNILYSKKKTIKIWWIVLYSLRRFIVDNQNLYTLARRFRKISLDFNNFFAKNISLKNV